MPEETKFRDAKRAQQSFLAAAEKRCLVWLAERLPARIGPDHLTALGLCGMIGVGLSYWLASWSKWGLVLASLGLVVNWFGDSLDGTVARVRNRLRPRYGFYVDHMVDAFGTSFLVGGLGLSGLMSPWVAAAVLLAYFLLNIEVYLATYTLGTFQMSFARFSPTELRLLLVAGNTAMLFFKPTTRLIGGQPVLIFDIGGVIGAALMVVLAVVTTVRHTIVLYREETR